MKDLQKLIKEICLKTDINAVLFTDFGECVYSSFSKKQKPDSYDEADFSVDGIFEDKVNGRTCFRFDSLPCGYFGYVDGVGAESRNYAIMLKMLCVNLSHNKSGDTTIEEKIKLLLLDSITSTQKNALREYFKEKQSSYYLLNIFTADRTHQSELIAFLKTFISRFDLVDVMDSESILLLKKIEDARDYRSVEEFATVLYENIKEELRIDLVIATGNNVSKVEDISPSYHKSLWAYKFGKLVSPEQKVYHYRKYIIVKYFSEMPVEKTAKYLEMLTGGKKLAIFNDKELMITADEFMKNSLNISETSREMFIHRNTLIYRLDKIEHDSGFNLRNFDDAYLFRIIRSLKSITE